MHANVKVTTVSNLHVESNHCHKLRQFGDAIDLPVCLLDVEPTLANIF